MAQKKVEFFGLSTCGWCRKTKTWLDDNRVEYQLVYMDLVSGEEKEALKARLLGYTSRLAFPVVVINDGQQVIQGYQPDEFGRALG